jgi:hypothetical protein
MNDGQHRCGGNPRCEECAEFCEECGEPIHADASPGVWLHLGADGATDHDRDADHTARPDRPEK